MENISKIVVCLGTGKRIGYVLDVALDGLAKVGYYIVDEESENEFLLKSSNIEKVTDKFVLMTDLSKLEFVSQRESSLVGREVLDEKGNSLGIIEKLCFIRGKCEKIITNICEIMSKHIKQIGEDFVFVGKQSRKMSTLGKEILTNEDMNIVRIQSDVLPKKVGLATRNFVGKVALSDVFGYNNEKIVLKNETITKAVVEKAKKHNKINQLYFAIKREEN